MPIKGRVESLAFISNFRVFKQKDLFVVVVVIFSFVSKRTSELMFQRTKLKLACLLSIYLQEMPRT